MVYVSKSYEVSYQVDNPEWQRLNDLLVSVRRIAPELASVVDRPLRVGPAAWHGGRADEMFARLSVLRSKARSTADETVEAVQRARDAQSRTLTKTRTEWRRVWVEDGPSNYV